MTLLTSTSSSCRFSFSAVHLVAQVSAPLSSFCFFSPHSFQSYLAAIDGCFSLAYLLSERHHGKGCSQTSFKLHVNNLNKTTTVEMC